MGARGMLRQRVCVAQVQRMAWSGEVFLQRLQDGLEPVPVSPPKVMSAVVWQSIDSYREKMSFLLGPPQNLPLTVPNPGA